MARGMLAMITMNIVVLPLKENRSKPKAASDPTASATKTVMSP